MIIKGKYLSILIIFIYTYYYLTGFPALDSKFWMYQNISIR